MGDTDGMLRGSALGRVGIGVDGFEGIGVARGVGLEEACFGCDEGPDEKRSGVGAGCDGCGVGFFRRAGLTYACADCSSTACLLIRDRGSGEAVCCHRGVAAALSGGRERVGG